MAFLDLVFWVCEECELWSCNLRVIFPEMFFLKSLRSLTYYLTLTKIRNIFILSVPPLLGGCFQNFTLDSAKKSFTVVIKSRNTIKRADGKSVIWNTYICTISKRPSCDCPYFLGQEDQTCKHIIWTLSNLFIVHQESSILYQVAFPEDEMKLLNKQVCCDIPRNLVFQGETYSNEQQQDGKLTQEKHQTDAERVTRALRKNPSCGRKKRIGLFAGLRNNLERILNAQILIVSKKSKWYILIVN